MNDGSVDIGATALGNPNIVEELPLVGIVAFYDRTWNELFTRTFGYSLVDIDNSPGQLAEAFRRGQYTLANLLYHPVEDVMWGASCNGASGRTRVTGRWLLSMVQIA